MERRRVRRAAGGDDRLSALPDDMLRLILGRLDTRSALATAALAKRWARLRRELPSLDFKISDVLPEPYREHLGCRAQAMKRRQRRLLKELDVAIGRYERQAMRFLGSSLSTFLDADADGEAPRRRVQRVSLELIPTYNTACLNRLVAAAVIDWGVEELEVVVLKSGTSASPRVGYSFPHDCFDDDQNSDDSPRRDIITNLKKLKLGNCAPLAAAVGISRPRPHRVFGSLTVLVLQEMAKSTRGNVYGRVIRACPMLETLHLRRCSCRKRYFVVDAPESRVTELVIDGCAVDMVCLRALPGLERLACHGDPVMFMFGSVPRLARLGLSFYVDINARAPANLLLGPNTWSMYPLLGSLRCLSDLESLVVRFTGPERWGVSARLDTPLRKLTRLLVADVPSSWDVSWTCLLLEAAPALETLHVQIVHSERTAPEDRKYTWLSPEFRHRALRELVIIGFEGTKAQVQFVSSLKSVCMALRNVVLLEHGRVLDKGHWDWEVVDDGDLTKRVMLPVE